MAGIHLFIPLLLIAIDLCESKRLKFIWGDVFEDPNALGPGGEPYNWDLASKMVKRQRNPKALDGNRTRLITPEETRKLLMGVFEQDLMPGIPLDFNDLPGSRKAKYDRKLFAAPRDEGCVPGRLCETRYNTTAPLYGVSLTSGKPVTIVQKFPDLLQQVVYQVCQSSDCDVLKGECIQTYLPYLFLTIPLGPVTLTGQDYVLVESGCVCKPKYAQNHVDPPPIPPIQALPQTNN